MEWTEFVAVVFSLAYVVLAAKGNWWCWPAGVGSSLFYAWICWNANLYSETGLQIFYLIMAFYGMWQWRQGGKEQNSELAPVRTWPLVAHVAVIVLGFLTVYLVAQGVLTFLSSAALPYLDAFTTVFSLIATVMVTRRILENWLYWIVIDVVSIYMYTERGLYVTVGLFVVYTVMAVYGFVEWRKEMQTTAKDESKSVLA
ncbi:nicotinamide mononucleotide transporter [Fulvitalea axinellae]|uniref:Nicotinamide riboside transporter PnuC n=1 Tax=Fulvitalea axinellae TaxID=1182444 RepID=A0AAU9CJ52_9BACT|nr:nicotinamide mononucleotide transporter [Fulvitalea axinellae]